MKALRYSSAERGSFQAVQETSAARRAKNRPAEPYSASTLKRGEQAQRSLWVSFSSLIPA